jgi:hypothetical protein
VVGDVRDADDDAALVVKVEEESVPRPLPDPVAVAVASSAPRPSRLSNSALATTASPTLRCDPDVVRCGDVAAAAAAAAAGDIVADRRGRRRWTECRPGGRRML